MVIGSLSVADIACEAIVGVLPHERQNPQPLRLGFSIWLNLEPAARSGNLDKTVNYAILTEELRQLVIAGQFELLETLVWTLAQHILDHYFLVQTVEITCQKPTALPGTSGPRATIKLERS